MKLLLVAGARPNFMKIAPLPREMRRHPEISPLLSHTGQHDDVKMAGQFFQDLQIPEPDVSRLVCVTDMQSTKEALELAIVWTH